MIAQNKEIKEELIKRWKSLGLFSDDGRLSYQPIIKDAMERSPEMKITSDRVSKWLSGYVWGGKKAGLTDDQISWFCRRWGLDVQVNMGTGDVKIKTPPYNELECLKNIKPIKHIKK